MGMWIGGRCEMSIHESWPWRSELTRDAQLIRKWNTEPVWNDRRAFSYEKKIFLSAYAIRKLMESRKLKSSFESHSLNISAHKRKSDPKFWHPRDVWYEIYEFEQTETLNFSARKAINTIIHSEVFVFNFSDNDAVDGFLFNSDQTTDYLFNIKIADWIELMERAAQSVPTTIHRRYDASLKRIIEIRE